MHGKICSLLFLVLWTSSVCKKNDDRGDRVAEEGIEHPERFTGEYEFFPSASNRRLRLEPNGSVRILSSEGGAPIAGIYRINRLFLRIYTDGADPTGVFPIAGFDPEDWRGRWNEQSVSLKKVRQP